LYPSDVEQLAKMCLKQGFRAFDADLKILQPRDCFEAATDRGRNFILLIPENNIDISEELEAFVLKLSTSEIPA